MQKTFASYSFGCRVNWAELESLNRELFLQGFSESRSSPSFYIINSCAVTQKAEREIRQFIYQTRKKYPQTKIIVTGCAASKWIGNNLKMPEVDWFVGNQDKENLINLLVKLYYSRPPLSRPKSKAVRNITNKFTNSGRLFVKIQDGCHRSCSYCIVRNLRGIPKSKKISEIVEFINQYQGKIQETILTAINTEGFGLDTGETFVDLLDQVIQKTNVPRISLGSLHPWSLGQNFFRFYEKILPLNRLVNFFHIPFQSGSNKILRLMNRGYTKEEFLEKLLVLKKINPFTFIATDVIIGFLDETNKDFNDTYQFLKDSPITRFHIFRFSQREGTPAFHMAKKSKEPTPSEKLTRAKILAKLGQEKYEKFLEKHLRLTFPALFLEKRIGNLQEALLNNQIPVFVKTPKDLKGQIKNVRIEKLTEGRLFAKEVKS